MQMHAFWTRVEGYPLRLELRAVSCHVMAAAMEVPVTLVLALQNFFQGAHFVFALTNVDDLVIRRSRNHAGAQHRLTERIYIEQERADTTCISYGAFF